MVKWVRRIKRRAPAPTLIPGWHMALVPGWHMALVPGTTKYEVSDLVSSVLPAGSLAQNRGTVV